MNSLFWMIFQVIVIALVAPFFDGIARVLRAKLQARKGPPDFFQTYRDIIKLFKRGRTVPKCSHWIFRYGPYMLFSAGAMVLAIIPITYGCGTLAGYTSDIFVFLYVGAALRFIFGVVSIDSGNPFSGIGGSREQMIALFVEPVMVISLLVVMLLAKTSNLAEIQHLVRSGVIGYKIPAFCIASISFLWAIYVETGRKPYDLAEAEQELNEGVLGDYCGSDLGLIDAGLILKQFAMIGIFLSIFEPWNFSNPILALIIFILETGFFYVMAVFIDNFGARYKLLTSFKSNAIAALSVSFVALILYIVGV